MKNIHLVVIDLHLIIQNNHLSQLNQYDSQENLFSFEIFFLEYIVMVNVRAWIVAFQSRSKKINKNTVKSQYVGL
jgi:hypothetical protein